MRFKHPEFLPDGKQYEEFAKDWLNEKIFTKDLCKKYKINRETIIKIRDKNGFQHRKRHQHTKWLEFMPGRKRHDEFIKAWNSETPLVEIMEIFDLDSRSIKRIRENYELPSKSTKKDRLLRFNDKFKYLFPGGKSYKKFLEMWEKKTKVKQMVEMFDLNRKGNYYNLLSKLNLRRKNMAYKLSEELKLHQEVIFYINQGMNYQDIAKELGISKGFLRNIRRKLGLPVRQCKIIPNKFQKESIRSEFTQMWENGEKVVRIARHFKVSNATIYNAAKSMGLCSRYKINELLKGGKKYHLFKTLWSTKSGEYLAANMKFSKPTLMKASKINKFPPKDNYWILSKWGKEKLVLDSLKKERLPKRIGEVYKRLPIKINYRTFQRAIDSLSEQRKITIEKKYGGKGGTTTIIIRVEG